MLGAFLYQGQRSILIITDNKDGSKDVAKYLEMPEAFKSGT